jgi:uncharacterized membrane protein (DUF4010 family)
MRRYLGPISTSRGLTASEHDHGSRTFGLLAIVGCMAGIAGMPFIWMAMPVLLVMGVLINWRRLTAHNQLATTTTLSLVVVVFSSVMCGMGHLYTPIVATMLCAALLSWKRPLHSFASGLKQNEIRSAVLLAALSLLVMQYFPLIRSALDIWYLQGKTGRA